MGEAMSREIDLTKFSVEELIDLNRKIVARVKHLQQAKSYKALAKFNLGDRVKFSTDDGRTIEGDIIRLNKKTVSLMTDDHRQWNVAPALLSKVTAKKTKREHPNVINLHQSR
jgi:hypothetical protein